MSEIYELVKANENIGKILPETVERLTALKALHEKGISTNSNIVNICDLIYFNLSL